MLHRFIFVNLSEASRDQREFPEGGGEGNEGFLRLFASRPLLGDPHMPFPSWASVKNIPLRRPIDEGRRIGARRWG